MPSQRGGGSLGDLGGPWGVERGGGWDDPSGVLHLTYTLCGSRAILALVALAFSAWSLQKCPSKWRSIMSHEIQHAAHTAQHREHEAWLADCMNWRIDHMRALSTLAKVESLRARSV